MRNEEEWMNYFSLHISMAKNLLILKKYFLQLRMSSSYFISNLWFGFLRKLFHSFYFQNTSFSVKLMDEALSREMKWVIKNLSNWWIIFTKMPVAVYMLLLFELFSFLQDKFYFWIHFIFYFDGIVFGLLMLIGCWFNHE